MEGITLKLTQWRPRRAVELTITYKACVLLHFGDRDRCQDRLQKRALACEVDTGPEH